MQKNAFSYSKTCAFLQTITLLFAEKRGFWGHMTGNSAGNSAGNCRRALHGLRILSHDIWTWPTWSQTSVAILAEARRHQAQILPGRLPLLPHSGRDRLLKWLAQTPARWKGKKTPTPKISALLRKRPVLLMANFVLTKDRKRPYYGHFFCKCTGGVL